MKPVLLVALVGACATPPPEDVVGPFTGTTHRYVVDSFTLPLSSKQAAELGDNLGGTDEPDNVLGSAISSQRYYGNITNRGIDMLAAATIASSIEIVADDLADDDTVSVRYLGANNATSTIAGGRIEGGAFHSNRTRYSEVPGAAELHLPVFVEASPSVLPLIGMEIDLEPDGVGGFVATIRGGVPADAAIDMAARGIVEMIESDPGGHLIMIDVFDFAPRDRIVTMAEVTASSLMASLLAPDLVIAGQHVLSFGFAVHLRPCESGNCLAGEPFDHCFDRTLDGDETDLDCGGSCRACEAGARCNTGTDCETTTCDAGVCGAPSCANGSRDGFETDVDCGSPCGQCAAGAKCVADSGCQSGECGPPPPPCDPDALFPCFEAPEYATCQ